jgi:hypothetical protein
LTTGITHNGPKAIKEKSYFKIRKIGWESKKAGLKGKKLRGKDTPEADIPKFSGIIFNKNDVNPAF